MEVNEKQKMHLIPKIKKYFEGNLKGKHFALWGLAFKPNTDDIREAPALFIIDALMKEGCTLSVFDPEAMTNVKAQIGDTVKYGENQYDVLENADALIIATEWNEFRTPNFLKMVTSMKNKVIFDGRNLFDISAIRELGFYYESIGRATAIPANNHDHNKECMSKKRVLITGAAGFLGSHLCDRFIKEGFHVIGMDNLITGDLQNIQHLFKLEQFEFYHQDVSKYIHVPGTAGLYPSFCLTCQSDRLFKNSDPDPESGFLGTHHCLGLAKAKNARILVASTSEIYGDPLVHPQTEEYWGNVNPVGPRGVYDEAKRFQEAITMAYHSFHKLETRIVRIFNTYGPRMRLNDGRALPAFIGQALRGEDLTVFGDGSQTRSFCYVDDLIEGIYRLLMSDYALPVNIGNPSEITLKEFAEEVIALTGTDRKIIYKPLPADDPKQRKPDISKAKKILNWEPTVGPEGRT